MTIKAIKNTNIRLNNGRISGSKYYSIKMEVLLNSGDQIPVNLQMPECDYAYITSAITGNYDGQQNTQDHMAFFNAIAEAIQGTQIK